MKSSGGLGFTLAGGADTVGGCFVRDIVGGPAKEDGRLQSGDQILVVKGYMYHSVRMFKDVAHFDAFLHFAFFLHFCIFGTR